MALKTDSLRLKNYADVAERNTSIPSPDEGEIAITGGVLQIYDSSWANVSSGGGGGGASELAQLDDVSSSPTTQYDVAFVNGSSELDFQPLLTTLTDSNALYIESQFADDNTHLMTARAIKNKIESYGYATASDFLTDAQFGSAGIMSTDGAGTYQVLTDNSSNWDAAYTYSVAPKNYTEVLTTALAADVTLGTVPNQKYIITSDPRPTPADPPYKFRLTNPASGFNMHTIIEIINHSDYDQFITTGTSHYMFHTNTGLDTTADIIIERGQRALITVSEDTQGNNYFFVTNLSA